METSGFFNANQLQDGTFDRTYLADTFADYFSTFIGNGIFANNLGGLAVSIISNTQRILQIATGRAFINGYWYKNDEANEIQIDPASTSTAKRYDSVMLRFDSVARKISLVVVKGTEGQNVYPSPVRDGVYYDLRLAVLVVTGGIITGLSDRRSVTAECGQVIGTVQSLDTTGFVNQLDGFLERYMTQAETDYQETYIAGLTAKQSAAQTALDQFEDWIAGKQTSTTADIEAIKTSAQSDWDAFKTQADSLIDGGQTSIQQSITAFGTWVDQQKATGTSRLQELVDELEAIIDTGDISTIITRIEVLETGQQSINTTLTSIQQTLATLATKTELGTALAGKMPLIASGTSGNAVIIGANGTVTDSGKQGMYRGDIVGGNLTGTLPNPNIANIAITQTSDSETLDWAGSFVSHIVGMNSQGRIVSREVQTLTLPEKPHEVVTEAEATADRTQRLMCVLE